VFLHRENTPEENREVVYLETKIKPAMQRMVPMLLYKRSTNPALHILNYVRDLRQRQEQGELKIFRQ
jgi:hypothetical protein